MQHLLPAPGVPWRMRKLACIVLILCPIALLPLTCAAQQNSAASRLAFARATYYTPTNSGLNSFHCTASMDWKDLLTRFSGADVPADSPLLAYLDTVQLSVNDDLRGNGSLQWTAATEPPVALQPSVQKLRGGLEQMFSGFFQTWNVYMNGSMVPVPDSSTTVTEVGDGVKLHGDTASMSIDELFDKNLLLTQAHVTQPSMDVVAYPTYIDTPDGRVISSIRSTIHQPPTAPPIEVTISTTYSEVQTFRLPAQLTFAVQNVGTFILNLSECKVQTSSKSAVKP